MFPTPSLRMHPSLPHASPSASASPLVLPRTSADSIQALPTRALSTHARETWDGVTSAIRAGMPRLDAAELMDSAKSFAGGSVSGALGALSVYPLDVVKTRMQMQRFTPASGTLVEPARYVSVGDCFRQIYKEGGVRALYSGLTPQLVGVAPEQAVKLTVNARLRTYISNRLSSHPSHPSRLPPPILPLHLELLSGSVAGLAQSIFTQPLEIVKIKLQTHGALLKTSPPYKPVSTLEVVRNIGGFRGLYRGFRACAARDVAFNGLYFPVYFYLKHNLSQLHISQTALSPDSHSTTSTPPKLPLHYLLLAGALAGIPASWIVTPIDVVKTRLQASDPRHPLPPAAAPPASGEGGGLGKELWRIYRTEGAKALFRGGAMRVARTAPQTGVTLAVFEVVGGWILGGEDEE
ncbi:mitochondrial carrier [Gonapodya prolifera JEL478]|uniref:Mitochondrial carrier n=1 Tax=Gonapodya prolifera (strain JEL478) TaxID=1344416 RepID=A0A139A5V9_GONPJ|nr:mitochondrial carrier [Gonapodya prolifera JEL478]|eukprot:KXS12121.1 mitochondrial carrier [Gonapodya prolifera JEL478]